MTDAERAWAVEVWRRTCENPGVAARKPKLCRHFAQSTDQARLARLALAREARRVRDAT